MVEEPSRRRDDGGADDEVDGASGTGASDGGSSPASAAGSSPTRARLTGLAERYVTLRAGTIARDGGPGPIVRMAARAPAVTTVVLAVALGAVFAVTFGVPPVSPLFLVALLCAPVYPWLRLEARAIDTWQAQDGRREP